MQSTYRVIYDISKILQEIYIDDFIFNEIIISQTEDIINIYIIYNVDNSQHFDDFVDNTIKKTYFSALEQKFMLTNRGQWYIIRCDF